VFPNSWVATHFWVTDTPLGRTKLMPNYIFLFCWTPSTKL
jgi:hypothetical protein